MKSTRQRNAILMFAVYVGVGSLILWRDYRCHQNIESAISHVTPTLTEQGFSKEQVESILSLVRKTSSELRQLTIAVALILGIWLMAFSLRVLERNRSAQPVGVPEIIR